MKEFEILDELKAAAMPLIEFYRDKLNPLTDTIIINSWRLIVVSDEMSIPIQKELNLLEE